MMRKLTLLFVALFILHLPSFAQTCGFDKMHAQMLANDPAYAQKVAAANADWIQLIQNSPSSLIVNTALGPVYEIPVVIHVIHTGGAIGSIYNPSTAQLTGMVDYLNKAYNATWGGYPDSLSGGTYFPVRFVLAQRDPNCSATSGINRVNGSGLAGYTTSGIKHSGTLGADEATVKALSIWPNTEYYNIWVVNKIDGLDGTVGTFVAGYAYFPGAPATLDGTIMLATQALAGEKTLPHEIGHAFNLYHTFEGDDPGGTGVSTQCPPNTNCVTQGDLICDTEPHRRSVFNCPVNPNPCTGLSYNNVQRNIMDYSSCEDRFTQGQRTRWFSALTTLRASLVSSLGATALPASPLVASNCIPTHGNPTVITTAGPNRVVFNDMTSVSGSYNADGNKVYVDNTCKQQANLVTGQSYTLSVRTGTNPERVRVYLDYNNDGIFVAGELIYSHDGTVGNETHSTTYTVPTTGTVNCTPLRMRVLSDRTIAAVPTPCGVFSYGQAEDYSVVIKGVSNTATVSIALTNGTNSSCINTPLTFTATPAGIPTSPTYKWYINGVAVTGATSTTFTSSTLANGNVVTSKLFYSGPCGADSSASNSITVLRNTTITPLVNIAITAGANPGCAGQSLTFTATPTNGGTNPTYQWTRNGVAVAGATASTFTTATLNNADVIRVVMTSNSPCASPLTATSNAIVISYSSVTATASIAQTGGTNPTCAGQPVTFTGTTSNGGTAPTYNWLVNGVTTGVTTTTFTSTTLNNNDIVQLLFVTNNPCVVNKVILSNSIPVSVIPLDTPTIAVSITAGSNPGCADSLLIFTATASSSIGNNGYAWFLNGTLVANGSVYNNPGLVTGDVVMARVVAGPGCHVMDTIYATPITVTRIPTPPAPFISFIGNMLLSNVTDVQWYGPSGIIIGATGPSYHPTAPGTYYATATGNGCPSLPSNKLQVSTLIIGNYNLDAVQIYPNPTNGQLVIDWGATPVNARVTLYTTTGQSLLREAVVNGTRKTLDLSAYAAGIYFIVLQDEQGNSGTVRITLNK